MDAHMLGLVLSCIGAALFTFYMISFTVARESRRVGRNEPSWTLWRRTGHPFVLLGLIIGYVGTEHRDLFVNFSLTLGVIGWLVASSLDASSRRDAERE